MSSIVDERGFYQALLIRHCAKSPTAAARESNSVQMRLSAEHGRNLDVHILELAAERASRKER